MPTYPVRKSLPVAYSLEIGRIITRWARVEWELKQTAYAILQIGPKAGRLALREPRAHEYLSMIEELVRIRRLSISDKLKPHVKPAKRALEGHGELRNALAHGIWIKHSDTKLPTLQITTGNLVNTANFPKPLQKAKIDPRALAIELSGLRAAIRDITELTRFIRMLRKDLERQLTASPDKREPQPPESKSPRTRSRAKRQSPPRSSRE